MSLESDLYTVLVAVCPRVYPDFAPVDTPRPYVTYQQIGGEVINFMGRELPSKRNATIQINVWASTRAATISMAQSIQDAVRMSELFQGEALSEPIMDFDAEIPVYGTAQDFTIWADR